MAQKVVNCGDPCCGHSSEDGAGISGRISLVKGWLKRLWGAAGDIWGPMGLLCASFLNLHTRHLGRPNPSTWILCSAAHVSQRKLRLL